MTAAQRVVNTFEPFVGTEGLRGVIKIIECDGYVFVMADEGGSIGEASQQLGVGFAHGYLLSKLAEGLVNADSRIVRDGDEYLIWHSDSLPSDQQYRKRITDYSSAILAAARKEWPGKKAPKKLDPTSAAVGALTEFANDLAAGRVHIGDGLRIDNVEIGSSGKVSSWRVVPMGDSD